MAKHETFREAPLGVVPNDGSGELQASHKARPSIVLKVPPYAGCGLVKSGTLMLPTRCSIDQPPAEPCRVS